MDSLILTILRPERVSTFVFVFLPRVYLKKILQRYIILIKCWGAVSHCRVSGVLGSGATRILKWGKLEYCNSIKIIMYNFVTNFYKNLFKIKKNVKKYIILMNSGFRFFSGWWWERVMHFNLINQLNARSVQKFQALWLLKVETRSMQHIHAYAHAFTLA